MHQENVELYKKLDMIHKENAELQMKVEFQTFFQLLQCEQLVQKLLLFSHKIFLVRQREFNCPESGLLFPFK